jgi:HKD family nuclease
MADIRDTFITQPSDSVRLGDLLKQLLTDGRWSHFSAAVAFVKRSEVKHISDALRTFSERGMVRMLIGVDLGGTSWEGLSDLLMCVGERGEIWVCHNESASTFHPKVYIFKNEVQAIVVVGSGNLTEGGLFTNYEASMMRVLNLAEKEDRKFLSEIDAALEGWLSPESGFSRKLTPEFLEEIYYHGYVVDDSSALGEEKTVEDSRKGAVKGGPLGLFAKVKVPGAPSVRKPARRTKVPVTGLHKPVSAVLAERRHNAFVMTLQRTDCGVGQMTAGTSRRSPEVFIPLSARKHNPDFWEWPEEFEEDPKKKGKHDRRNVSMELEGRIIHVNMMTWPAKHDFRLRSEALRSAGNIGDILKIKKSDDKEVKYRVEVIKKHSQDYSKHLRLCSHSTPNSKKRWGYL